MIKIDGPYSIFIIDRIENDIAGRTCMTDKEIADKRDSHSVRRKMKSRSLLV
jgi:hypothetical protein